MYSKFLKRYSVTEIWHKCGDSEFDRHCLFKKHRVARTFESQREFVHSNIPPDHFWRIYGKNRSSMPQIQWVLCWLGLSSPGYHTPISYFTLWWWGNMTCCRSTPTGGHSRRCVVDRLRFLPIISEALKVYLQYIWVGTLPSKPVNTQWQ